MGCPLTTTRGCAAGREASFLDWPAEDPQRSTASPNPAIMHVAVRIRTPFPSCAFRNGFTTRHYTGKREIAARDVRERDAFQSGNSRAKVFPSPPADRLVRRQRTEMLGHPT